ncbi:hypothetical protein [Rhodococcus sp. T7]|nr:hypothetical protein [Rhodococcus sp. T7]
MGDTLGVFCAVGAQRRCLQIHANVLSTTDLRGRTVNPQASSVCLTT